MQKCYSCNNSPCCPEHCCDWDHCLCKDCENCGGVAQPFSPTKKTPITTPVQAPPPIKTNNSVPKSSFTGPNNEELTINEYIKMRAAESLKQQREEEAIRQAKFDEQRLKDRAEYESIIESTRKCLARNREVLENTTSTLSRLHNTIEGIRDTEKKYEEYKEAFGAAMKRALEQAFGDNENIEDLKAAHGLPVISNVKDVVKVLKDCRKIAIITGAGVSAESGVFTYKDNEEKYLIAGAKLKLQEIMNINIYDYHPLEFWQNIQFNRNRFKACSPNAVHEALFQLMQLFKRKGRKVSLITQNIDGFDKVKLANNPDFYEIHGNTNEMRCKALCTNTISPCPDPKIDLTEVPTCKSCASIMRPNVLLYGESYSEEFYRANSAIEACKEADALIIIGTQIKCGFPEARVKDFGKTGKPIIEINIDPVVEFGRVLVLNGKCGQIVPPLVQTLSKLISQ